MTHGHRLVGLSLHFGEPASTSRAVDISDIAAKAFQAIEFRPDKTTVLNGRVYQQLTAGDDRIKQALYSCFGVSLSVEALDSNIQNLQANSFGRLESIQRCKVNLSEKIAHVRWAEVAQLAASSLSPAVVTSVAAVLSSLSDSLHAAHTILSNEVIDANLFTTDDSSIVLINSRFETVQTSSRYILLLCGISRRKVFLNLNVRRIGFTTSFTQSIKDGSPHVIRKIQNNVLLPPSPQLAGRSATAPSSVPVRSTNERAQLVAGFTPLASPVPTPLAPSRALYPVDESPPARVDASPLSVLRDLPPRL